jgi:hypothetical protein
MTYVQQQRKNMEKKLIEIKEVVKRIKKWRKENNYDHECYDNLFKKLIKEIRK